MQLRVIMDSNYNEFTLTHHEHRPVMIEYVENHIQVWHEPWKDFNFLFNKGGESLTFSMCLLPLYMLINFSLRMILRFSLSLKL
jgi:hypothetical protein